MTKKIIGAVVFLLVLLAAGFLLQIRSEHEAVDATEIDFSEIVKTRKQVEQQTSDAGISSSIDGTEEDILEPKEDWIDHSVYLESEQVVPLNEYTESFPEFVGAKLGDAFGDFKLSKLQITSDANLKASFDGETTLIGEFVPDITRPRFNVRDADVRKLPLEKDFLCFVDVQNSPWYQDLEGPVALEISDIEYQEAPKGICTFTATVMGAHKKDDSSDRRVLLTEGESVPYNDYTKNYPEFIGVELGDSFGDFKLSELHIKSYDYLNATYTGQTIVRGSFSKIPEWSTVFITVNDEDLEKVPFGIRSICFNLQKVNEMILTEEENALIESEPWHPDINGEVTIEIKNIYHRREPKGGCGFTGDLINATRE